MYTGDFFKTALTEFLALEAAQQAINTTLTYSIINSGADCVSCLVLIKGSVQLSDFRTFLLKDAPRYQVHESCYTELNSNVEMLQK